MVSIVLTGAIGCGTATPGGSSTNTTNTIIACPEGTAAKGDRCEVVWGHVEGTLTLKGQTDHGGIVLYLLGTTQVATTTPTGDFAMDPIRAGSYTLEARRPGFETTRFSVTVSDGQIFRVTGELPGTLGPVEPGTGGTVAGTAQILGRDGHSGITASLEGGASGGRVEVHVSADGRYQFAEVPAGVYTLEFRTPFYEPVTLTNLIVAPGVYRVQPVVLTIGAPIKGDLANQIVFAPDSSRALMRFPSGTSGANVVHIFNLGDGTFRPLPISSFDVYAFDATSRYVLGRANSSSVTQRLDLQTGDMTPVTPNVTSLITQIDGKLLFRSLTGELYLVSPDSTTATLAFSQPCQSVSWGSTRAAVDGVSPVQWRWLEGYNNCEGASSHPTKRLISGNSFTALGFIKHSWMPPDSRVLIVTEMDDPARPRSTTLTIKRVSLDTGAISTIATQVSGLTGSDDVGLSFADDWSYGYGSRQVDTATQRGTLFVFDPKQGTATDLISGVSSVEDRLVRSAPNDFSVVDWESKSVMSLCAGPNAEILTSATKVLACRNASQPGLKLYNPRTKQVLTLSSSSVTGIWLDRDGIAWNEGQAVIARHIDSNSNLTLCASGFSNTSPAGTAGSASGNGRIWNYTCGSSWKLADAVTGTIQDVLGSNITGVEARNCTTGPTGDTAVCAYTTSTSSPHSCGANATCIVTRSNGVLSTPIAWPTKMYYLYWIGSWSEDGKGFFGYIYGSQQVPNDVHWTSLYFVNFGASTPLVRTPTIQDMKFLGAGGRFALWQAGSTMNLYDSQSDSSTVVSSTTATPKRLGSTSEYVIGDVVVNMATGQVITLGSGIRSVVSVTGQPTITYFDGATNSLRRYQAGGTPQTLATQVQQLSGDAYSSFALYWTEVNGTKANLAKLDATAGTLTRLVSDVFTRLHYAYEPEEFFVARNPSTDGTSGDLTLVKVKSGTVVDLKARAVLPLNHTTSQQRVVFVGQDELGRRGAYASRLDGTGTKRLGNGSTFAFSTEADRVYFDSDGLQWVEGKGSAASLPLDRVENIERIWISPDEKTLFFTVNNPVSVTPRQGTFRAALP